MKYQKFNISESNLSKGMVVKRESKTNQTIWCICRIRKWYKWTFIHRRYISI